MHFCPAVNDNIFKDVLSIRAGTKPPCNLHASQQRDFILPYCKMDHLLYIQVNEGLQSHCAPLFLTLTQCSNFSEIGIAAISQCWTEADLKNKIKKWMNKKL